MLKLFNKYFPCSEYEPTLPLESLTTIIEQMDLVKVLALLKKPRGHLDYTVSICK